MQVTIEGVVDSDVIGAGEQRRVELTDFVRGLLRSKLVRVLEWHHPEAETEPEPVKPARKRRTRKATE